MSDTPCPGWPVKLSSIKHLICVTENSAAPLRVHDMYLPTLPVSKMTDQHHHQ